MDIRIETPDDIAAIAAVVEAAFQTDAEARLVEAIRVSDGFIPGLSLVAERDGVVVGHVMVSYASLADEAATHRVAILAPVAVHPDVQSQGIGKALVRDALARADEMGEPMVVLEGSPRYYGSIGFEPSSEHGIEIDLPDWAPAEAAQVYRLSSHDPSIRGRLILPESFAGVE